ncbi:diacylglycerol kinase family lipid kinase [Labilibaculum sp. DW002]|uniref:Diacylglycerol kinase family lipid kinase n=1 Tax=Paralabilibaculum antarcticum TaxID=2912572 RepID=A0ABT5VWY7_9BACT|nr:diacylglycerol kinase family protein [Labilibaculum sp. DW002]MDE5419822.1 diacylglycerol kinase family lipid kinase [Labilibaculum sp. DW002]
MITALKTLAIVNPISGTGKQKNIECLLKKYLDHERFHLQVEKTGYAGHGTELAKLAVTNDFDVVIAIGGDGTINEIANALTFSDVAMGIIPCGSGNGLARHLGIPMNTKRAIQCINKATINKIDTIRANDYRFINVAGIGFDALIAHEFAKMKSRGLASYAKAILKCFRIFSNQSFVLKNKEIETIENGMMLCFANSSQFGNNAYIAPSAKVDDGKINISLLKKPKWFQIPVLGWKVFTKGINTSSLFSEIITNEITIVQQSDQGHIDGEPIYFGKEIHLKIDPLSLKLLA